MAYRLSDELKLQIGSRIRERRKKLKWSACKVAELSGIHRNTISRVEQGESVSIESLCSIALALELSLDNIVAGWSLNAQKRLLSSANRGPDVLYPVQSGMGSQRPGAAPMQTEMRSEAAGSSLKKEPAPAIPPTLSHSRSRLA